MDVWTVQKKEIIDCIKAGKTYLPDYDYCAMPDFSLCYQAATEIWNELNSRSDRGVIFTLARKDGSAFRSVDELKEAVNGYDLHMFFSQNGIGMLDDDHVLVRLEYDDGLKPAPIDVYAFTALTSFLSLGVNAFMETKVLFDEEPAAGDPVGLLVDGRKMRGIWERWSAGEEAEPMFSDGRTVLQLHYGFIAPGNLTGEEYPAGILVP